MCSTSFRKGRLQPDLLFTIDHLDTVRDEISCTPLYLTQHLSHLTENIHQYISACTREIYLIRFFYSWGYGTREVKISQNRPVLAQNPTGLITYSSGTLETWDSTYISSVLSGNQFSGWFYNNGGTSWGQ